MNDERCHQTRLHAWLVAVVAGMTVGIPALGLAIFGIGLAIALLVGAALSRPRLASVSGVLIGLGLPWSFLLARGIGGCDTEYCDAADVWRWLGVAIVMVVAGLTISASEAIRIGRPR